MGWLRGWWGGVVERMVEWGGGLSGWWNGVVQRKVEWVIERMVGWGWLSG